MNDTTYFAIKCMTLMVILTAGMFCGLLAFRPEVKIDPIIALAGSAVSMLGGFIGGFHLGKGSGTQDGVATQTKTEITTTSETKPSEVKPEEVVK